MITVASFPDDLGAWDQDVNPFYLEVFGETEPLLDMTHAEVIPVGGSTAATATPTPIYEYWWTIGHPLLLPPWTTVKFWPPTAAGSGRC